MKTAARRLSVVMVIISAFVSENFFSWVNISNVLKQSAVPGIVSLGMLVVILTAGIDLSVGSLVAITGVLAVGMQRQLPLPLALLVAIAAGLAAGGFNGVLVAKRNVPPFIATLGMLVIARGLTYVYTDGVSWNVSSDISLKENIEDLDYGLGQVLSLRPVRYNYKGLAGQSMIGFIAQEVEDVIPELVSGKEGSKGIAYSMLAPVLVGAIQEQQKQIDALRAEIEELKALIGR